MMALHWERQRSRRELAKEEGTRAEPATGSSAHIIGGNSGCFSAEVGAWEGVGSGGGRGRDLVLFCVGGGDCITKREGEPVASWSVREMLWGVREAWMLLDTSQ